MMNRTQLWLLLLLSGLLAGLPLRAQDSLRQYTRPAVVKTNLTGPFSLILEVPTRPRQSVQLSVQRINFGPFRIDRFFSLTADYRFYLSQLVASARRPAPKGLYLSPYLKFRTVDSETTGKVVTVSYSMLGGGVVVGTQAIRRKGFTLDAFLGGGYFALISSRLHTDTGVTNPPAPRPQEYRLDVRVGLCLGLAFARPRVPAMELPGQTKH